MADMTAFEMITSRVSNYADGAVAKYQPVAIAADGQYTVAQDDTLPFIGICQYGVDAAGQVITVVRGIFPGIAGGAITAGAKLAITGGKFTVATKGPVIGIALTAAAADELVAVQMLDTPFSLPSA